MASIFGRLFKPALSDTDASLPAAEDEARRSAPQGNQLSSPTVDPAKADYFAAMSLDQWWNPKGRISLLHGLNPLRVKFVEQVARSHADTSAGDASAATLRGVEILDVGCGGGLVSEELAKAGAQVLGIDVTEETITIAQKHLEQQGDEQLAQRLTYRQATAEQLLEEGARFPVVIACEVLQHVSNPASFVKTLAGLVQPGGSVIVHTENRTVMSFVVAIVGGQWITGWIPKGTLQWRRLVQPQELARMAEAAGLRLERVAGCSYNVLTGRFSLTGNPSVSYLAQLVKVE